MRKEKISEAIGNINSEYVQEAMNYTNSKKSALNFMLNLVHGNNRIKWIAIAICFALIVTFQVGILQGNKTNIGTLDDKNIIHFYESSYSDAKLDIDASIRILTESEIKMIFKQLPVTGSVFFHNQNNDIMGMQGNIGEVKLTISVDDYTLRDTIIIGEEKASEIDGVSIHAGYSINNINVIYYATFELGNCNVYVEQFGATEESERIKTEITTVIQDLIQLKEINLEQIVR